MSKASRPSFAVWAGLGLVTLLAAFLRFYKLNELPPGLWFDEAYVSVQARNAVASQVFPIYLPTTYGGIHPAILYLTILARWLTFNHPLAIRFGVAAVNVLIIPTTYWALRAIFQLTADSQSASQWAALGGAVIMAVSFPMVLVSRLGFEVTLPTLAGLCIFGGLALALRTGQHRYDILVGLALGGALYTYQSARLFPVAVVVIHLWLALTTRRWRQHLMTLLLTGGLALMVVAPLGFHFLQHPEEFWARATITTYNTLGPGASSIPLALLNNVVHTFAGISWPGWGDQLMRHNWPGQPLFDFFVSGLFWLGLLYLLSRSRQSTAALLLTWAWVMLLPTLLTDNAPAFTRLMGAMPALAGVGAVGGLRLQRLLPRRAAIALITLGGVFSLTFTAVQYFGRWANDPRLYDAFQLGDWNAAQAALKPGLTAQVYLTPNLISPDHPTFDLLLAHSPVRAFANNGCLVYPSQPRLPSVYVVDALDSGSPATLAQIESLFPQVAVAQATVPEPEGFPLYNLITLPAEAHPHLLTTTPVDFGDQIRLAGHSPLPGQLRSGETLTITLHWQVLASVSADYSVFVHVIPAHSPTAPPSAQHDAWPCVGHESTSQWQPGEGIADPHPITLPADLAPGPYAVWVGLYEWASGVRLPVTQPLSSEPDRTRLGTLTVR